MTKGVIVTQNFCKNKLFGKEKSLKPAVIQFPRQIKAVKTGASGQKKRRTQIPKKKKKCIE